MSVRKSNKGFPSTEPRTRYVQDLVSQIESIPVLWKRNQHKKPSPEKLYCKPACFGTGLDPVYDKQKKKSLSPIHVQDRQKHILQAEDEQIGADTSPWQSYQQIQHQEGNEGDSSRNSEITDSKSFTDIRYEQADKSRLFSFLPILGDLLEDDVENQPVITSKHITERKQQKEQNNSPFKKELQSPQQCQLPDELDINNITSEVGENILDKLVSSTSTSYLFSLNCYRATNVTFFVEFPDSNSVPKKIIISHKEYEDMPFKPLTTWKLQKPPPGNRPLTRALKLEETNTVKKLVMLSLFGVYARVLPQISSILITGTPIK